jgi:hypothetical protein
MSGIPQFNYPRFEYVAGELRTEGHDVLNPAEMDDEETRKLALASKDGSLGSGVWNGESWGDFLSRDVKIVADEVDAVCLLENWRFSRGARTEAYIALTVGKPCFVWNDKNGLTQLDDEIVMDAIYWSTIRRGEESHYG